MHGEGSVQINASAEKVFPYLYEIDLIKQWQTSLIEGEQLTPGEMGVGTRIRDVFEEGGGRRREAEGEITAFTPNERIRLNMVDSGFIVDIDFRVQPQGTDQVTVHQTVDGEPRNAIIRVIFAIISPLFMNRLANRQIAGDLQKLKQVAEAG